MTWLGQTEAGCGSYLVPGISSRHGSGLRFVSQGMRKKKDEVWKERGARWNLP